MLTILTHNLDVRVPNPIDYFKNIQNETYRHSLSNTNKDINLSDSCRSDEVTYTHYDVLGEEDFNWPKRYRPNNGKGISIITRNSSNQIHVTQRENTGNVCSQRQRRIRFRHNPNLNAATLLSNELDTFKNFSQFPQNIHTTLTHNTFNQKYITHLIITTYQLYPHLLNISNVGMYVM